MQVESAYRCKLSPPKSSTFSNHCTLYYKDCQTSLTCLSTISPCLTLAPAASRYRVSPYPGFNSNYLFSFQLTPGAAAAWPGAATMPPRFLSPSLEKLDSIQRGAGSSSHATEGEILENIISCKNYFRFLAGPVSSCQSSPSQHSVTKPARTRLR